MAEDYLMSRVARHSDFAPLSFRDKAGAFGNNVVVGRKTWQGKAAKPKQFEPGPSPDSPTMGKMDFLNPGSPGHIQFALALCLSAVCRVLKVEIVRNFGLSHNLLEHSGPLQIGDNGLQTRVGQSA